MLTLLAWVVLLFVVGGLAYYRAKPMVWIPVVGVFLAVYTGLHAMSYVTLTIFWAIWLVASLTMMLTKVRMQLITVPFLFWFRKQQPPLTSAERIALEAGGVWWEKAFFDGDPDWSELDKMPEATLTPEEQAFIDNQVETLCSMLDDWKMVHDDQDMPKATWDYIKKEKFLGLVIDKEYKGLGFSAVAHSAIVSKIASRSVSAAVSIMVPNSLGPAEFLSHYGTKEQKDYYLPRLAEGKEIPCFGLTAPNAGSDATNLSDTGVVCKGEYEGVEVTGIRLNFNKRYITLAPITTLLGLAFQLYDPDHLLGDKDFIGITLALIPSKHPGVETGPRHAPLNLAFMNGPLRGKDVFIPLDFIIGGKDNVGRGWQMMMECLAVGRGISLPSLATGAAKFSARMTGAYAKVREQFKRPIGDFEGVQLALSRIGGLAYLCEATRLMSALAVDADTRPSVASAIVKYHLTEIGRKVVDDAMDVHGGRGIQMGPSNYLGYLYTAIPVCITVEGANILTRNLIIFGQGVLRCHPYLEKEIRASEKPDDKASQEEFDHLLCSHVGLVLKEVVRSVAYGVTGGRFIAVSGHASTKKYYRQLTRMSNAFALLTEASLAVLGNKLKFKEALSARLGDILSHLFMASAVLKYFKDNGSKQEELVFVDWSIQYCLYQMQQAFNEIIDNFPNRWVARVIKVMVFPWGRAYKYPGDKPSFEIAKILQTNSPLRDYVTRGIFVGGEDDPTGSVEAAFQSLTANEALIAKLKQAVKQGRVSAKQNLQQKAKAALEQNIISEGEYKQLAHLDALVWDSLQVDEFGKNKKKGNLNDKQQHQKTT
ncbi:MAG: acyl-CoA dehydrogenase [Coxiellaceae bacterium]|nr:acyl-CoA dehydrogenase [Coxiellaceae bacterium]